MASCYADCRGAVVKLEHERAAELELDAVEAEELAALFAAQEEERQRLASAHRAAVAELRARHSAETRPFRRRSLRVFGCVLPPLAPHLSWLALLD